MVAPEELIGEATTEEITGAVVSDGAGVQPWLNAGRIFVEPQLFESVQLLVCALFAQEDQLPQLHDSEQEVGAGV